MLQGYFLGLATSPAVVNILSENAVKYGPAVKDFLIYLFTPYYVGLKPFLDPIVASFNASCKRKKYMVKSLEETFGLKSDQGHADQGHAEKGHADQGHAEKPLPTYTDQPGFD